MRRQKLPLHPLALALLLHASGHAAAAEPAKPAVSASASAQSPLPRVAQPDPKRLPMAAPDPIERLRERLAEKLGATKSPNTPNPNVLQVAARVGSATAEAAPPRPAARPRAVPAVAEPHASHWGYEGAGAPDRWAALKPEFSTCGKGTRQSPVELRDAIRVDLDPIAFDYKPAAFRVVDNGHTVQVDVEPGNHIEVRGRRFELLQFHFHRPSEEVIDGRRFDMSLHLVHRDAMGKLAVVAVPLEAGPAQPAVQQVWNNLPLERSEQVTARTPLDAAALLPTDRRYFATMGSLTTPPCDEGVLWLVMAQPVSVSPEQVAIFARLYPMNARPLQPAAGRLIQASR